MDNLYVTVKKIVPFGCKAPGNNSVEEAGTPGQLALSFWLTFGVKSTLNHDWVLPSIYSLPAARLMLEDLKFAFMFKRLFPFFHYF